MTISAAFSTAWRDFKSVATKIVTVLSKDEPAIQTAVTQISAGVVAIAPALAPEVTAADQLEEVVMGKLLAAANVAANAPNLAALLQEAWPAVQSLSATLANHPTVASVTAALSQAPPAAA